MQTMFMSRQEARNEAAENAESLNRLINPSDVIDGADSWSDVPDETIERECHTSAEIMMSEKQMPFARTAHELAVSLHMEGLPRVAMEELVHETHVRALKAGVWPNECDKYEAREIIEEYNVIHHTAISDAAMEVQSGIVAGMMDFEH